MRPPGDSGLFEVVILNMVSVTDALLVLSVRGWLPQGQILAVRDTWPPIDAGTELRLAYGTTAR